jgi:hypothetical protein
MNEVNATFELLCAAHLMQTVEHLDHELLSVVLSEA